MKIDESALEEKSSFNMLGLSFSSKLDWALLIWILDSFLNFSSLLNYIISVDKTASKKIGALICSMKFFSPEVALHLLNLPYNLLLCLGWSPSCCLEMLDKTSYKRKHVGLWFPYLLCHFP